MFDVITIGTATRDVFLSSSNFKVLKDKEHLQKIGFQTGEAECFALGAKIEVEAPVFAVGGGAANAAVTFARQGLKTAAIFKIGRDESGDAIVSALKKEKVVSLAIKDKNLATAYSTILLTNKGERTILVHRGASGVFREKEVPLGKLHAKWAYIVPGTASIPFIINVADYLKKRNVKIAMNPSGHYVKMGWKKLDGILKKLDLVIVNREEAALLTDMDYDNVKGIFRKFDQLIAGIAVVTDGPRGAFASDGRYMYKSRIFKEKELRDRTGAGDAFGSGLVAGLILKNDMNFAMKLAAANSTSVVEQVGAQAGILRKDDVKNKRWQYLDLDVEPL